MTTSSELANAAKASLLSAGYCLAGGVYYGREVFAGLASASTSTGFSIGALGYSVMSFCYAETPLERRSAKLLVGVSVVCFFLSILQLTHISIDVQDGGKLTYRDISDFRRRD